MILKNIPGTTKKILIVVLSLITFCLIAYGTGRLYFKVTDGFRIAHITSDFPFDPRWETRALAEEERAQVDSILSQKFTYLGKGCQSYVFLSEDGEHVLKFFKYQRFRPQFHLSLFSFIKPVEDYLQQNVAKKTRKRENLFASWKCAFDFLPEETGLVYVHLNKTSHLGKTLTITDKVGIAHYLNMDDMEFLIQKRAAMLCATLDKLEEDGESEEAKELITNLIRMIVAEYRSGFADNDHALMQNTGVYKGRPIHIDVGQFEKNDAMRNPAPYHQELFNKTWKFRNWLRKKHPGLLAHADQELVNEMGDDFYKLTFIPKER